MPRLVLEPLKEPVKPKRKKKEAPKENHFADRQANIDEKNRVAALTHEEAIALKRKQREEEVANVVKEEHHAKEVKRLEEEKRAATKKRNKPTQQRPLMHLMPVTLRPPPMPLTQPMRRTLLMQATRRPQNLRSRTFLKMMV